MLLLILAPLVTAAAPAAPLLGSYTAELDARHISYKPAMRPGIALGVEITGPLGGVAISADDQPLVIDCSLAISLDEAGRYLRGLGIARVTFSSAYSRRNVRGTHHASKHSFGLAIDLPIFAGPAVGTLRVDRDFEQGLGDEMDCVGAPLTKGGAVLEVLKCQLVRSGLFRLVLTPDYDDAHHDHFHLEAPSWADRSQLRSVLPAIH